MPVETKPAVAPATVEDEKSSDVPAVTTSEYIVLDAMLYLMLDDGKGQRRTRRYPQGSTVKLEERVARNLLAEPRPSVMAKPKDD